VGSCGKFKIGGSFGRDQGVRALWERRDSACPTGYEGGGAGREAYIKLLSRKINEWRGMGGQRGAFETKK